MLTEEKLALAGIHIVITKNTWLIKDDNGRVLTSGRRCFRSHQRTFEVAMERATVVWVKRRVNGFEPRFNMTKMYGNLSLSAKQLWSKTLFQELEREPFIAKFLSLSRQKKDELEPVKKIRLLP